MKLRETSNLRPIQGNRAMIWTTVKLVLICSLLSLLVATLGAEASVSTTVRHRPEPNPVRYVDARMATRPVAIRSSTGRHRGYTGHNHRRRPTSATYEKSASPGFNFLWLITSRMGIQSPRAEDSRRRTSTPPPGDLHLHSRMSRKLLRHLRVNYSPSVVESRHEEEGEGREDAEERVDTSRGTVEINRIISGSHIGFEMEFRIDNSSGSGYIIKGRSVAHPQRRPVRRAVIPQVVIRNQTRPPSNDTEEESSSEEVSADEEEEDEPSRFGLFCQVIRSGYVLQLEYRSTVRGDKRRFSVDIGPGIMRFGQWYRLSAHIDFETNTVDYWLNCTHTRVVPEQLNRSVSNSYFNYFRLLQHRKGATEPIKVRFRSVVVSDGKTASTPKQCFSTRDDRLVCRGGQVFLECGPSCEQTCANRYPTLHACTATCVRGCHCPPGLVLDHGTCVRVQNCSCRIGKMRYPAGSEVAINFEICTCASGSWKCFAIPQMTQRPENRTVKAGRSTNLTCAAGGNPVPTITWHVPPGATNYRVVKRNGNRVSQLFLDRVTLSEAGVYNCTATREVDGWSQTATAMVNVVVPPTITIPRKVFVTVGSRYANVDCTVTGNPMPRVAWKKHKSRLRPGVHTRAIDHGVYRLKIDNVQQSDAGIYICIAINDGGYVSKKVYILAKLPAPNRMSFRKQPRDRYVKKGKTADFPCQIINHNRNTNVTWYKDDKPLAINGRRIKQKRFKLVIKSVTARDVGTYKCSVAQTSSDVVEGEAKLGIKGRLLSWQPWTKCSASCGRGTRTRRRICTGIPPNGKTCKGKQQVTKKCRLQVCPGVCSSYGDPNYTTFDGYSFNFQGDCGYVLSKDAEGKKFEIVQYNAGCGNHLSCTHKVTAILAYPSLSAFVEISRQRAVLINGAPATLPYVSPSGIMTIAQIGLFVVLRISDEVEVQWAVPHRIYVIASGKYTQRTLGLCGNFNGNRHDDRQVRGGKLAQTDVEFGQSWSEPDGSLNSSCSAVLSDRNRCHSASASAQNRSGSCTIIRERRFSPCHSVVNPERFEAACKSDICASPLHELNSYLCTSLSAYTEACLRKGITLNWRSPDLCPEPCGNRQHYRECGPSCLRYCPTFVPNGKVCVSHGRCLPGCYCRGNTVIHNNSCIPLSECPCLFKGMVFRPGALHDRNCQRCTCTAGSWRCTFNSNLCDYPATVIRNPSSQIVPFGDSVTLCCGVVGIPAPIVHWYREGSRIQLANEDSRQSSSNSSYDDMNSTLHLRNVSMKDAGAYSCKAINKRGSHNSEVAYVTVVDPAMSSCDPRPKTNYVNLPEGCFVATRYGVAFTGANNVIDLGSCDKKTCYSPTTSRHGNAHACSHTSHCCQASRTKPIKVRCRHQLYNTSFDITVIEKCSCGLCSSKMTYVEGVVKATGSGRPLKHVMISHQGRTLVYTSQSGSFRIALSHISPNTRHVTLTFVDALFNAHVTAIRNVLVLPGETAIHEITMVPYGRPIQFHASRGLSHRFSTGRANTMRLRIPPHSVIQDGKTEPYRGLVVARVTIFDQNNLHRFSDAAGTIGSNIAINITGDEQIFSPYVIVSISLRLRNDQPVDLMPGKSASLGFRFVSIRTKLLAWVLDDLTGYWREHTERLAVKPVFTKLNQRILLVTARIKRFNTPWALGSSKIPCYLRAQASDERNETLSGVKITFTTDYNKLRSTASRRRSVHTMSTSPNVHKLQVAGLTRGKRQPHGICLPVGCHDAGILYASKLGNDLVLLEPEAPPSGMGRIREYKFARTGATPRQVFTNRVLDTNVTYNATGLSSHHGYFQSKEECLNTRPNYQTYVFRDHSNQHDNRVIELLGMIFQKDSRYVKRHSGREEYCHIKVRVRFHSSFDYRAHQTNVIHSVTFKNATGGANGEPTLLGWSHEPLRPPLPMQATDDTQYVCVEYVCGETIAENEELVVYMSVRRAEANGDVSDVLGNLAERPNCNFTTAPPDDDVTPVMTSPNVFMRSAVSPNRGGYVTIDTRAADEDDDEDPARGRFRFTHQGSFRHVFQHQRHEASKRKCATSRRGAETSAYFECW